MNKLFLDIGNSFIKFATVVDDFYESHKPISFSTISEDGLSSFSLESKPDVIYFSSVANSADVDSLKQLILDEWQVFPIQLTAQRECCGLTSGYSDFSQLGDDRWFAMQGAIGIYQEPVIIVDAGTALTVDSVIDGKHQGGFIVPGLYTMRKSLASNTNNLQHYSLSELASHSSDSNLLANNTAEAILGGTLYMVAAFINQIVSDLNSQIGTRFKLILTGGESVNICRLLDSEFDYIPDLVLQGMVNVEECVKK